MITTRVVLGGMGIVIATVLAATPAGAVGGKTGRPVGPAAKSAATVRCQGKELGVTLTEPSGGLTHQGEVIEFKNHGGACTITGYPGVDALNAEGHRVLSAKRTKSGYLGGVRSGPIPKVHLATGKTASALVEWGDLGSPCPRARSLRITPPNAVHSVVLAPKSLKSQTLCHFQVHPVVAGTTGAEL